MFISLCDRINSKKKRTVPMLKSIKVMLVPNNKQRTRLFQYAGASRFAYNWALRKEMDSLLANKGFIPDGDLRKEFTRLKKQPEYAWTNTVSNDVMKQAVKDLCTAYKQFFKKQKQPGYQLYSEKFLQHLKRIGKTPSYYDRNGHPKFNMTA